MAVHSKKRSLAKRLARGSLKALLVVLAVLLLAEFGYRGTLWVTHRLDDSAEGTFELYGLGGSTTCGEPFHHVLSLPSVVSNAMGDHVEGRPIEVRLLAELGSSVFPQLVRFRRAIVGRNPAVPGAVLIYSGHNEQFVPDGEAPLVERGLAWLERHASRHSMLLSELLLGLRKWQVTGARTNLAGYEEALRSVVEEAREAGLTPVLSTVVGNVTGPEPSIKRQDAGDIAELADALQKKGDLSHAEKELRTQAERFPVRKSYALWRLARMYAERCDWDKAKEMYSLAHAHREASGFSFYRCASEEQNEVVRRLARELDCPLFDAVAAFEANSPQGLIGWNLFFDGHHPNLDGYALLATGLAKSLSERLGVDVPRPFADGADVDEHVSMSLANWADVHFGGGRWLLGASVDAVDMKEMMTHALSHLAEAARLEPHNPAVWFALAIWQAEAKADILADPEIAWDLNSVFPYNLSNHHDWSDRAAVDAAIAILEPHADPETLARAREVLARWKKVKK